MTTSEILEFDKVKLHCTKYSSTEFGKIKISNIIPFENFSESLKRGKLIQEAKDCVNLDGLPPFEFLDNLNNSIVTSKIQGALLSKESIFAILSLSEISRKLQTYLINSEYASFLNNEFEDKLFSDKNFEYSLRKIFTETGDISDNASKKLKEIRNRQKTTSELLDSVINKILKKLTESYLVREEYITQRDGRVVLPIKSEHKRHVKGFIHSESATGQTVYIEPEETLELNNELLSLHFEEKREIERILKSLTSQIGENSSKLLESFEAVSELDLIFSLAQYSIEILGHFPEINDQRKFKIVNGRHPLLIKKLGRNNTIPLNIDMNEFNIIVITGPNAGGKTVVLKTLGLLTLMVQCGMHIPAEEGTVFPDLNTIHIDIGDKQSIENDLSTFSSHLTNIKAILANVKNNSLVLLDELGTGTDPTEGAALAIGILNFLKSVQCFAVITTHHGNLKVYAENTLGIQNASMEFDTINLIPTYNFSQGVPGSSYAFEIAKRIGISDTVLDDARRNINDENLKLENLLIRLEEDAQKYRTKLRKIEIENSRLTGLANLYEEKIKKLEKQKKDIIKEAKDKADNYLNDVNKKIESSIKSIIESKADKKIIKEQRQIIQNIKIQNTELVESEEISSDSNNLEVGDYVKIKDTTSTGELVEVNIPKGIGLIRIGSLKLKVNLEQIEKIKKIENKKNEHSHTMSYQIDINSSRLDIRGKKPDEIEFEIVKFVDDAYASGLKKIDILHGKGAGILKNLVKQIVSSHSGVNKYYYEHPDYGGDGITIVEFK